MKPDSTARVEIDGEKIYDGSIKEARPDRHGSSKFHVSMTAVSDGSLCKSWS